MTEYQEQLSFYVEDKTRRDTERFFRKYWLSGDEYLSKWKPTEESTYAITGQRFPNVRFRREWSLIALRGGRIFAEEDFYSLQACMVETGDTYFAVVEHLDEINPYHGEPRLRFKFPADITWQELMSGGYVSQSLFEWPVKEYLVFGNSGMWGKVAANDYILPVDLIGYDPRYSAVFRLQFEPLFEREILNWLPQNYLESDRQILKF